MYVLYALHLQWAVRNTLSSIKFRTFLQKTFLNRTFRVALRQELVFWTICATLLDRINDQIERIMKLMARLYTTIAN